MSSGRKTNRRQFLKGRSAADALADLAAGQGSEASLPPPESHSPGYLVQYGRRAMACQFELFLNAGQYASGSEAALEALDLVDALEAQLSVYRDDSEVSRLNARAAEEPVVVEDRLFGLLERAVELHRRTEGAYDVTAGPLSRAWGFFQRAGRIPEPNELIDALARVGTQYLELDAARRSVRFRRPGMEVNFGSIGKGHALDRCGQRLLEQGVVHALLHGGQSSVLALGSQGDRGYWTVGVGHPLRADRRLAEIRLRDRALATSGSSTQFFQSQGRRFGHLLDPRTGQPAEAVLSSTVIAPLAADADALSTAFYVGGAPLAERYCAEYPEVSAILILDAGAGRMELCRFNVVEDDLRLLEPAGQGRGEEATEGHR